MLKMKYLNALEAFLMSGKDFTLVYKPVAPPTPATRLLILDSSFNPPHMGHFTLAKEALDHDFGTSASSNHLLLLLSVKNADKVVPVPASFEHRLSMMHLMAKALEKSDISVSIGLTTHAKFAEKSAAIQAFLGQDSTWMSPCVSSFITNTDLFCLTRAASGTEFDAQQKYMSQIASGHFPDIPRSWARNIFMKTVAAKRDTIGAISSSGIRHAYDAESAPQNLPLLEEIDGYIRSNNLYGKAAL
ncbi:hypothetical protein JCM33374_g1008 [Metschnikowia sp. JCM 33374]|nr:hypothetical protein JCM33374_g1008 [Metschnikowia sp. JCM 33374]